MRDADAGGLLELLFVTAVAAILVNRAFLSLTGYPKIAFGHFHIAHMLWGGLLMLAALVMVFRYWNPSVRRLAAFASGVGFGLFIDELGKFITRDNDYFFKPTIAIIYIIFVVMYLSFRRMTSGSGPLSAGEVAFNRDIRAGIRETGQDTDSPLLRGYRRARTRFTALLRRMLCAPKVVPGVMLFFVLKSVLQFASAIGIVDPAWLPLENLSGLSIAGGAASSLMVVIGLLVIRANRPRGVHWFKRAVLLNIFVTQVFLFYRSQLTAVWGLAADLLIYQCIDYYLRLHSEDPGVRRGP
ncbi:MAG: hypothetical protein JXA64_05235 [Candidatus Fermentibacteraceae bacterium]|nr:hypothetical protein [Candidatus Fermentibacteraceae bacterium]